MNNKIKIPLIILVAVGLFLYAPPLALGWLLGFMCLGILAQVRERFYSTILDGEHFKVASYIGYILFVFVILWLPLGLAFFFPKVISAYSLAASYIIDRFLLFVSGAFKKEVVDAAS